MAASPEQVERVRTAEVIGALSLATDLGTRAPLEQGLYSTLVAMRLAKRLGVDEEEASRTYYACLLFYVGCTAGAETATEVFGDEEALTKYGAPGRFGSRREMVSGMLRALAPPDLPMSVRAGRLARGLPKAARVFPSQITAFCQVGQMLTDRLGLPSSVRPRRPPFGGTNPARRARYGATPRARRRRPRRASGPSAGRCRVRPCCGRVPRRPRAGHPGA